MTSIRCCMVWVAGTIVVWSGLLAAPARAQGTDAGTKLRYQALNVFQQYCLKCHGDSPKGNVRVLDHALLVQQRRIIHPGSPDTSELFDLVQGGSMPPGNYPKVPETDRTILKNWIQRGAAALPSIHDESYVLWSIVCHLRTKSDEEKRSIRYLSLNHLIEREGNNGSLVQHRQRVEQLLRKLAPAGKKTPILQAIEQTESVFCIDLKDLGWDRPPYPQAKQQRWRRLNLFDLILLEYPYGRLPPTDAPFYRDGILPFLIGLQEAGQVRPIAYVRADWFAELFERPRSPLYQDFLELLGKSDKEHSPNGSQQPELGSSGDNDLTADRRSDGQSTKKALERGVSIPDAHRGQWRSDEEKKLLMRHNDRLLAELLKQDVKQGIAILPLDGITYPDLVSANPMFRVEFRATDFKDLGAAKQKKREPNPKYIFAPNEKLGLWFKASEPVVIELYFGKHKNISEEPWPINDARNGEALTKEAGIPMDLKDGVPEESEEIVLFAYAEAALKSAGVPFPKGSVLSAIGIHDRVVHPLYELLPDGQVKPPDPSKMVKKTLHLTTRRRKAEK